MVTKTELKRKLREEEVKAIYDSIDNERLDKLEKEHQWYLEFTKKEYHPISYQIKQEEEEYMKSFPVIQWLDDYMWTKIYTSIFFVTVITSLVTAMAILLML